MYNSQVQICVHVNTVVNLEKWMEFEEIWLVNFSFYEVEKFAKKNIMWSVGAVCVENCEVKIF